MRTPDVSATPTHVSSVAKETSEGKKRSLRSDQVLAIVSHPFKRSCQDPSVKGKSTFSLRDATKDFQVALNVKHGGSGLVSIRSGAVYANLVHVCALPDNQDLQDQIKGYEDLAARSRSTSLQVCASCKLVLVDPHWSP